MNTGHTENVWLDFFCLSNKRWFTCMIGVLSIIKCKFKFSAFAEQYCFCKHLCEYEHWSYVKSCGLLFSFEYEENIRIKGYMFDTCLWLLGWLYKLKCFDRAHCLNIFFSNRNSTSIKYLIQRWLLIRKKEAIRFSIWPVFMFIWMIL